MATIKSKRGMSVAEASVHWLLILMTCGLWYPVYRVRKYAASRITTTRT